MTHKFYEISGNRYDRVTKILEFSKDQKDEERLRKWMHKLDTVHPPNIQTSLDKGTKIHKEIELFLTKKEIPKKVSQDFKLILPYLNLWRDKIIEVEKQVYSKKHSYAGTLDAMLVENNELTIIDWTTSQRKKKLSWLNHKFLQTTAYAIAHEEQTGIKINNLRVVVIWEKIQIFNQSREKYEQKWFDRLNLYRKIRNKINKA